jgi:Mor family transcriptional regulator
LRHRLSEQDLSTIIASFKTGTPAHVLAKRYGLGETAVKSFLRQRGARHRQQPQAVKRQAG